MPIRESFKLSIGYAFKSSKCNPVEPETVVIGETERDNAKHVGSTTIDGAAYRVFKCGRSYYFQLAIVVAIVPLDTPVFTASDIKSRTDNGLSRIDCERDDLVTDMLEWQKQNLSYTATGYGAKIPTSYKINFEGRLYRVYCMIYSNIGTCYILTKQYGKIIVDAV